MKYTLMHKNISVADVELDDTHGYISKINNVISEEHLPVSVFVKKGICDRAALNDWWTKRAISTSRDGFLDVICDFYISCGAALLPHCYGLSLSDQYWIKPFNSDIAWKDINFFDNPFSDDLGNVLFGKCENVEEFRKLDLCSPDATTIGNLKKRWKLIDGKRCLLKGGSGMFCQEPFNEMIASEILERLKVPHVPYSVMWCENEPFCVCENFITPDTDLIPAWRIMQMQKKDNSTSFYQHFVNCCEAVGLKDIRADLDRMLVFDYIIANEDRHYNNFGLVRNAVDLAWVGFSPIFDSGTSLGYRHTEEQMRNGKQAFCKPFKSNHDEQIKLVTSFDWVDFDKLKDIDEWIIDALSDEKSKEWLGDERIICIAEGVRNRVENVATMCQEKK